MLIQYTPPSGLGDIIHAWSSTYDFCTQTNIPFKLLFETNTEFRGNIEQYFDISQIGSGIIKNVKIHYGNIHQGSIVDGEKIDLVLYKTRWNREQSGITVENIDADYAKTHNVFVVMRSSGIGYNHSYNWKDEGKIFDLLKPSNSIQDKVDAYMKEHNWTNEDMPIGMHIRRTDHKSIIENYPTQLFLDTIDGFVKDNPKVRIFLCTDDAEMRHSLVQSYKNNIFTRETLNRYAKGATEDALVDMFLLSKCSKIYGTYSGFCRMSSRFGHIDLIDVKSKQRR